MMAFQNLVNEINEEKAHYRFHCLPNYTTDVNRTMQIAKLLGNCVGKKFGSTTNNISYTIYTRTRVVILVRR